MLQQILVKTPVYVWAILAFLIYRGVIAARDRDITVTRMLVIPLLMLALALQSVAAQFGLASAAMAAWAAGTALVVLQRRAFGRSKLAPGTAPGTLRICGSWTPLAVMLAIFVLKYALAVLLAIRPYMADDLVFGVTVCGLLGLCNGYFLGQLISDIAAARRLPQACSSPMPDSV